MTTRWPCIALTTLCCLFAVATSALTALPTLGQISKMGCGKIAA